MNCNKCSTCPVVCGCQVAKPKAKKCVKRRTVHYGKKRVLVIKYCNKK